MKKWFVLFAAVGLIGMTTGCNEEKSSNLIITPPIDTTTPPPASNVVVLDDFETSDAYTSIGNSLGQYKMSNMTDTGKSVLWGGGSWYALASKNGAKIISGDADTILDGTAESESDPDIIKNLFFGGRLQVEMNCQNIVGNDYYWAGLGCDLAGDAQHASKFDTIRFPGDSTIYWDLSNLASIRFKMFGEGSLRFSFESQIVKSKFAAKGIEAWGFHGSEITLKNTTDSIVTVPIEKFLMISDAGKEIGEQISWDQAKTAISGFLIELDTEKDDFLDLNIDKIELVFKDTNNPFTFK